MYSIPLILSYDLIGSLIIFIISYFSFKALRITRLKIFFYMFLGFSLMATGLMIHGIGLLILLLSRPIMPLIAFLYPLLNRISIVSEIVAYLLIAVGYSLQVRHKEVMTFLAFLYPPRPRRLLPYLVTEQILGDIISMFLLLYIVFHALIIYRINKRRDSFLIFTGFLLILLSHLISATTVLARLELGLVISKTTYFAALISFLAMIVEVIRG